MRALLAILILLLSTNAWSGDYHQDGQGHRVSYTILDALGGVVSTETVRVQVIRGSDGYILDHNDNTFKTSGWTVRYATVPYETTSQTYTRVVTIDSATMLTGDYLFVVSDDSATYKDQQTESVNFDNLNNLIKIHR